MSSGLIDDREGSALPLPWGEGWGEGVRSLDRPGPLTRIAFAMRSDLSPAGLRDSRILSLGGKSISLECVSKTVPAVAHGLGSRWLVVAIPAAETSRDPCDEGERADWMRVFLP